MAYFTLLHKTQANVPVDEPVSRRPDGLAGVSPPAAAAVCAPGACVFTSDDFFRKPSKGIFKADDKSHDRASYRPSMQFIRNSHSFPQIIADFSKPLPTESGLLRLFFQ
ncbi:hypothetical protein [Solidesulfovibrio sp.]|uniref:hypothetical protein n=1 Tax=Solidesulfovibrio sp. TaxID=2910990 RepID=UPI002628178B|nr:hypothetical protein [Solidesulfovibrio sp.]